MKNYGVVPSATNDLANKGYVDTVAGKYLPSYAPATSKYSYNTSSCWYNWKPTNTRKLKATLSKASTSLQPLTFIGDSETDSYVGTFDQLNMWPLLARDTLVSSLGVANGGNGWVKAGGTSATNDPRITTTGAWTATGGNIVMGAGTSSSGATITFTASADGTTAEWTYADNSTSTINYVVRNAAGATLDSGSVTPTNTNSWKTKTSTGLVGAHSITLTTTGSGGYIGAFRIGRAVGITVNNLALYGTTTGQWQTPGNFYDYGPCAVYLTPTNSAVFCALGVNDLLNSVAISTITNNLTNIRNAFSTCDFFLIGQYQSNSVSLATWQQYLSALYTLSDTLDVPLWDWLDRTGGYTAASSNGLMADATHAGPALQRDFGRSLALQIGA